jgi:hypothetical protein
VFSQAILSCMLSGAHKFELDQLRAVLADERTQIRSDPVPGLSVDTLGGYRVGNAATRSESDSARSV